MNQVELRHLRALIAIEQHGQINKAAEQLHLTQSALSHQLATLEHQLDCELLHRGSRPLHFTESGRALLALAHDVLPKVEKTGKRIARLKSGDVGKLHIGFECHSCFDWLIPTLDDFQQQWPGIDVDLTLGFTFDPYPPLLAGELDAVITSDPIEHSGISYLPLFQYETLLTVSPRSPLAKKKFVEPEALSEETLICYPVALERLDIVKRFLAPQRVHPKQIRTAELTIMILQLVACGKGVAGLPNWTLPKQPLPRVSTCRLGKHGTWGTLYVAVRKSDEQANFIQSFLSSAKKISVTELTGIKKAD